MASLSMTKPKTLRDCSVCVALHSVRCGRSFCSFCRRHAGICLFSLRITSAVVTFQPVDGRTDEDLCSRLLLRDRDSHPVQARVAFPADVDGEFAVFQFDKQSFLEELSGAVAAVRPYRWVANGRALGSDGDRPQVTSVHDWLNQQA